jgi:protein-tyrosine phosphatase
MRQHMESDRKVPFLASYWLPDGSLIAGQYPGAPDADDARDKINALLDVGVRTFVDLTAEEDGLAPYDDLLREEAALRNIEVEYVRIPIRDAGIPKAGIMEEILDIIHVAQERNSLPYVHCWGGIGRTGTVVGCHLIETGQSANDALSLVQKLFEGFQRKRHPFQSPETEEQRLFVSRWQRREKENKN